MRTTATTSNQQTAQPRQYKNQWEQMRAAAEKLGFLEIVDMKAVLK